MKLLLIFISVLMLSFVDQKTPYAEWYDGKEKVDTKQGGMPRGLNVKIFGVDDKEVKCRIKSSIMLARGSKILGKKEGDGNTFNLVEFLSSAQAGDRIVIELKEVVTDDERKRTLFVKDATLSYPLK